MSARNRPGVNTQLTLDDLTAADPPPEDMPEPDLSEVGYALREVRNDLGFSTWGEAWHAVCGSYKVDPDPRILNGTASLSLFAALCAEDPLAERSLLCKLAEIGAAHLARSILIDLVTDERKARKAT